MNSAMLTGACGGSPSMARQSSEAINSPVPGK